MMFRRIRNGAVLAFGLSVLAGLGACRKSAPTVSSLSPPAIADEVAKSGLKIEEIKPGDGPVAAKGRIVAVHYTGYLPDGSTFDTTRNRQPLQFQLGEGTVLKGWDLGVQGMKVGESES